VGAATITIEFPASKQHIMKKNCFILFDNGISIQDNPNCDVGHLFEPELIALLILSLTLVPIFILISPPAKQEDKGEPRGRTAPRFRRRSP
jgi:hypothetical protein